MKEKKPEDILTELERGLSKNQIVKKLGVSHGAVQAVRDEHSELTLTAKGKKRIAPREKKERGRQQIAFRTSPEMFDKVEEARNKNNESTTVFMNGLLEEWGSV